MNRLQNVIAWALTVAATLLVVRLVSAVDWHNETLIGAVIGAGGAIAGGWLGAYLLMRTEDAREARRRQEERELVRRTVVGALRSVRDEAAGNQVDLGRFLAAGREATTGLLETNFRTFQELLSREMPADVFYLIAPSFRQLEFARRIYVSGRGPGDLTKEEQEMLEHLQERMRFINQVLYGVLTKDYAGIEPAGDPRETVKRYLGQGAQASEEPGSLQKANQQGV